MTHILDSSWPPFLDYLDSDPPRAFREFYSFAYRLLKVRPPKVLRLLGPSDTDDVIQNIIYHCVDNDFAVLRRYSDAGRPFAAWFYRVATNKIYDLHRARKVAPDTTSLDSLLDRDGLVATDDPMLRTLQRHLLETVAECISGLDEQCQLLLQLAAQEYRPTEVTEILGISPEESKKVSDQIRHCRKKLLQLLKDRGLDLAEVLKG